MPLYRDFWRTGEELRDPYVSSVIKEGFFDSYFSLVALMKLYWIGNYADVYEEDENKCLRNTVWQISLETPCMIKDIDRI